MTEHKNCAACERTMQFIESLHDQLAAFASESYRLEGRGVTLVRIPVPPSDVVRTVARTDMTYHVADDVRRNASGEEGSAGEDAEVLVRMVETYDPSRQAVLTVAFQDHTISVKMKLDLPFWCQSSPRVH